MRSESHEADLLEGARILGVRNFGILEGRVILEELIDMHVEVAANLSSRSEYTRLSLLAGGLLSSLLDSGLDSGLALFLEFLSDNIKELNELDEVETSNSRNLGRSDVRSSNRRSHRRCDRELCRNRDRCRDSGAVVVELGETSSKEGSHVDYRRGSLRSRGVFWWGRLS